MKAEYVRVVTTQYQRVNSHEGREQINPYLRHMYQYIYPQIWAAVRRGAMWVKLARIPPMPVVDMLKANDFLIHLSMDTCEISWASSDDFRESINKAIDEIDAKLAVGTQHSHAVHSTTLRPNEI